MPASAAARRAVGRASASRGAAPPPPNVCSHTPVKSGSFAIAAQSASVGAFRTRAFLLRGEGNRRLPLRRTNLISETYHGIRRPEAAAPAYGGLHGIAETTEES